MSFFSKLTSPSRKGEKNFERGRAAEGRRDFDKAQGYFQTAAEAFDAHLTECRDKGKPVRPSHLVMAGMCYTRLGRDQDALDVLGECLAQKQIPDGYLHAGYAAAKLGQADKAIAYWEAYPAWAEQKIVADALKEQVATVKAHGEAALQPACEAIAEAVFRQDKANTRAKAFSHDNKTVPPKRGY